MSTANRDSQSVGASHHERRFVGWVRTAVALAVEAGGRWSSDSCYRLGASLAYCALFSLFPLLLLCTTVFGFILGDGDVVRQRILEAISGGSSHEVRLLVDQTLLSMQTHRTARGVGAVAGLLALIVGASGVFAELEASLNSIWRAPAQSTSGLWSAVFASLRARLTSFAIVLLVAVALFASLSMGTLLNVIGGEADRVSWGRMVFSFVELACSALVLTGLLAALYRTVPQRPLQWRDVVGGALIAAVAFTALKGILAFYLAHLASYSAYGVVGGVLGLLTWIYIASLILFYGAEFGYAYACRFGSLATEQAQVHAPSHP